MRFHNSGPDDGNIPPEAYQLADHLDAALAAAEDLIEAGRQWVPATADAGYELVAQMAAERQVIERVRMFETVLIGRVLKARKRSQELARTAGDLAGMTRLFVGGTAPLLDAVEELGDSTRADFETGNCHIAYLRQRGVIAADAADLPEDRTITFGDGGFLVAGRITLAPLTELIVAFLDALDLHYDLYPDEPDGAVPFDWADIVGAARNGDFADAAGDRAVHGDTFAADAMTREAGAMSSTAATATQDDTFAVEALPTGADALSRPIRPVTKAKVTSLVDRLDEIARALE